MKRVLVLFFFLVLFLLHNSLVSATLVVPTTLENMTERSDAIVIGYVKNIESYMEDRSIYTSILIQPEEFVKHGAGVTPHEIVVKMPGGRVGNIGFEVDEAPVFEVGEKVLVFLVKIKGHESYQPYGLYYGVFRVQLDYATGKDRVRGAYFESGEHLDLKKKEKVKNPDHSQTGDAEIIQFRDKIKKFIK